MALTLPWLGARLAVSAAASSLVVSPTTIANDGTTTATITVTARDVNSVAVGAASIVISATGSNNTITRAYGTANSSGVFTATIASTTAETKTISATANNTSITQTGTLTVTSGTVTPVLTDDFHTYANLNALKAASYWDGDTIWSGGTDGSADLDTSEGYGTSAQCIKITFLNQSANVGGPTTARCGSCTPSELNVHFPSALTELWIEVIVKFSSNFNTAVPGGWGCSSGSEQKFLFGRVNGGTRWQINVGGGGGEDTVDVGYSNDQSAASFTLSPSALFDGQWHVWRWHLKRGTAADGAEKVWFDGAVKTNLTGLTTGETNTYGLAMFRNLNHGPDEDQNVKIGSFSIYDTDPGW